MRIFRDPHEMQQHGLQRLREGVRVGLVPTMGALHEGHLALCRKARELSDEVVVSIFVNPAQFGPTEDFNTYPRTFESDREKCEREGVGIIYSPTPPMVYPEGFQTYVNVEDLAKPLCGACRPVFFRGVATVVLKLFLMVQPRVAVFGWKDAQQFILLKRMVKDLNVPVEMVGLDTVRESDGLAMSSRNQYLSAEERAIAPVIYRGLQALEKASRGGTSNASELLTIARQEIEESGAFQIQYLEMLSQDRLDPIQNFESGNTLVAISAFLGKTRLIDNIRL